jgi:hypothetical protein
MNQIPRLLFFVTRWFGNMIGTSLHCHVGKPKFWSHPPNWS